MKVGLSVCYDTKNFGSQLQVLATVKKIEALGFETEIIRYRKKITIPFAIQQLPRLFNPYFIHSKLGARKKRRLIKKNIHVSQQVAIRNRRFNEFVKIYFNNLSKPYYGWQALKNGAENNYDIFLCGSDQLWLPNNLGSHFYTLEFAPENKPKIAYATSFGVGQIPWYQRGRTRKYLNRFEYLSTREIRGKEIIKDLVGKEVPVVCDPTLLLSAQEWEELIPTRQVIEDKYIFCYFLGTNSKHREYANRLKQLMGLKIVTIPFLDNFVEMDLSFGDYSLFDVDAADFVNLIRNAEYVLTDSFHGSVFSILNHKQFVTFSRFADNTKNSRNSRILSLFQLLDLEDRHFTNGDIDDVAKKKIFYDNIDRLLIKIKNYSIEYLKKALN